MTADQQVRTGERRLGLVGRSLLASVRWYRDAVSPALPARCRFYPTCSAYAATALQRFGPGRGSWLSLRRILRCHPWHPGGVDHVPSRDVATSPAGDDPRGASELKDLVPQRRPASQETAVA